MESEESEVSIPLNKLSDLKIKRSFSGTCLRSARDKLEEFEEGNQFTVPGIVVPLPRNVPAGVGNECMTLREAVTRQQQMIQSLSSELEKERNASSSAANETMSMILRLQRDKAEQQMEARQFKTFADEKMAHDQLEIFQLEHLLHKKEEVIHTLTYDVQAYKHRMMSYGLTEDEADGDDLRTSPSAWLTKNVEDQYAFPREIYPYLKCESNELQAYPDSCHEISDIEKYAFGETLRSGERLRNLGSQIGQLEQSPRVIQPDSECIGTENVLEKVIVGHSPRMPGHLRKFSTDSPTSSFVMGKDIGLDFSRESPSLSGSFKKKEVSYILENSSLRRMDVRSEAEDDLSDRVCMIDSVFQGASINDLMDLRASVGIYSDERMAIPRESLNHYDARDLEIQKLYARLRALEADRELMRQAIISMGANKTQVALLKEIAQNLYKDMHPARAMPVRKRPVFGSFSFMTIFKWIISNIFWRRKQRRCKYTFGLSANNAGLLLLLDRWPQVGLWRCICMTDI